MIGRIPFANLADPYRGKSTAGLSSPDSRTCSTSGPSKGSPRLQGGANPRPGHPGARRSGGGPQRQAYHTMRVIRCLMIFPGGYARADTKNFH
jgi:hypothetical protein